ncbi:MAG: hypothetical protein ACI867_002260 [Glaciecola sp.]|jgi:hypothetical protein
MRCAESPAQGLRLTAGARLGGRCINDVTWALRPRPHDVSASGPRLSDDDFQDFGASEFEDSDLVDGEPLDDEESELVRQDLVDLEDFEQVFTGENYRGVSVFCRDCVEDHFYTWDMLRENLTQLLATGETPVHEPAFAPEPSEYVPWDYAHGYLDALRESGVFQRRSVTGCPQCGVNLGEPMQGANFCPRCGHQLLAARLRLALATHLTKKQIEEVLRETGLPD